MVKPPPHVQGWANFLDWLINKGYIGALDCVKTGEKVDMIKKRENQDILAFSPFQNQYQKKY